MSANGLSAMEPFVTIQNVTIPAFALPALAAPYPLHAAAVLVPLFSAIMLVLDLPPLIWHLRHGNVGASALILWLAVSLAMNAVNGAVWPRDNALEWFNGHGLCDVEVRLRAGAPVGVSAALAVILRRLAAVLDTNRAVVTQGRGVRRRQNAVDCLLCFGAPLLLMLVYYVVQSQRFDIFAITGCSYQLDGSWPTIALVLIWPPVLSVFSCYYASEFNPSSFLLLLARG
jgi:pheromone a factor receptor